MKRIMPWMLVIVIALTMAACGTTAAPETTPQTEQSTAEPTEAPTQAPEDEKKEDATVAVDEGLFNVTITIPAEIIGETTQDELEKNREEQGYKSATLNDDGSVTFVMSKAQHRELLDIIDSSIKEGIQSILDDENNPGIEDIEAGKDYKEFTVRLNTAEMGMAETMAGVMLFFYGRLYNAYIDGGADNIHLTFVNNADEVIYEADSRDMNF